MNAHPPSPNVTQSAWFRYGGAITLALAAAAVRLAFLQALEMRVTYITFYPAVILAALCGGLGPGLLATGLSALLADYFWIEPVGHFLPTQFADSLGMGIFAVTCMAISWITDAMQRARSRATRAEAQAKLSAELAQANQALREAEETLRRGNERLALLSYVVGRLLAAEDPQGIVNELCAEVMRQLDCDVFFNFLADPASGRLHLNACAGIPAEEAAKIEWLDYGVAVCGCVAQEGCRIVAEDISRAPHARTELVKSYGVQAYACHPLLDSGRVIGTLSFGTRNRTRFTADELLLMKTVADHVAVAMQRKQAEVALRESEALLRRAQEIAHLGSWELDLVRNRLTWSDEVYRIFGLAPREFGATYEAFLDCVHPEDRQRVDDAYTESLRENRDTYEIEHRVVRKDNGAIRIVHEKCEHLRDAAGQRIRSAGMVHDITERKRLESELQQRNQELAQEARRKDEFLAMLAHELRNPLAPIRNAVYLLHLVGPAEPRLDQARDMIDRQVAHMVRLMDDLLDVSRITRGKISLRKEQLDLAEVVAQAAEVAGPLLTRKRQAFTVSCAPEPIEVEADPARLVQVIANLLNNAAKFTEPGGSVTLSTERSGDGGCGDAAVIRVRDTGVGITPELLPHVFDLFVQGETSLDRTEGGLGIGLTLVRHVVEQHGGHIEAHSAGRGCGSEFVVTWPAAPSTVALSPRAAAANDGAQGGRRLRILVVEDNLDAAESFAVLLQLQGHEIRVAHSGLAALDVASSFVADVAFIDLGLPGMDGYEVARRLRAIPAFQATVLVALTGYGQEEDRRRSLGAGLDHHLTKPVDPVIVDRLLMGIGGLAEARPGFPQ
jgi:PAS domain S-box-containing protein